MLKFYGLSAYNKNDELINETRYSIPTLFLTVLIAKHYKKKNGAHVVEIHNGTRNGGFYKYFGEV